MERHPQAETQWEGETTETHTETQAAERMEVEKTDTETRKHTPPPTAVRGTERRRPRARGWRRQTDGEGSGETDSTEMGEVEGPPKGKDTSKRGGESREGANL